MTTHLPTVTALAVAASACLAAPDGVPSVHTPAGEIRFVTAFTVDQPKADGFNADWPFGGISGLEMIPGSFDRGTFSADFYAISDDRAEHGPARMARIRIDLDDGGVTNLRWAALTNEFGSRFDEGEVDAEAVRLLPMPTPGTPAEQHAHGPTSPLLIWTSEGNVKKGTLPAIFAVDSDRNTTRIDVPRRYWPDTIAPDTPGNKPATQSRGIQHNRGFESLAVVPINAHRWFGSVNSDRVQRGLPPLTHVGLTTIEEPLVQDRSDAHRVCRVATVTPRRMGEVELLYPLGPVREGFEPDDRDGLVELIGIPDLYKLGESYRANLVAMERARDKDDHYDIRLYWVSTEGAADASHKGALADIAPDKLPAPMLKRELLNLKAFESHIPGGLRNFEGLAMAPGSEFNRVTLVLVSDNSHGEEGPTVFVVLDAPAELAR